MLNRLLEFSLRQRPFVLLVTAILAAVGLWSALRLPLDAVPDIINPQVQINTAVAALAPEEIEKQVTFPLENQMSGIPGMVELRSLSKSGLSQVTMIFEDGTDLYRARQLVSERTNSRAGSGCSAVGRKSLFTVKGMRRRSSGVRSDSASRPPTEKIRP